MYKAIVSLILLFNVSLAIGRYRIVASNTPIASIVSLVVRDEMFISSICNINNGCPHHYSIKPNELSRAKYAEFVVYIDDSFETFMPKLLSKRGNNKDVWKLSDIELIQKKDNWHIWLSIENIRRIAGFVLLKLTAFDPGNDVYSQNYQETLKILDNLEQQMQKLKALKNPVLLDDSLEYFFSNFTTDITRFYSHAEHMKPQDLQNLEKFIEDHSPKCIFISSVQDAGKLSEYLKNKTRVISLETESWEASHPYDKVLEQKMINMINAVESCL